MAVYIDATFIATRRDKQVSKEAYHTILGVLEDGIREVLSVVNHPSEGAICWKEELEALKERGVARIDLVVSDALQGIENAFLQFGSFTSSKRKQANNMNVE